MAGIISVSYRWCTSHFARISRSLDHKITRPFFFFFFFSFGIRFIYKGYLGRTSDINNLEEQMDDSNLKISFVSLPSDMSTYFLTLKVPNKNCSRQHFNFYF